MKKYRSLAGLIVCALFVFSSSAFAQRSPEQDYLVYALSESADKITLIRFGPRGARVERELSTGVMAPDIDGPHGIAISPDKEHYFVSLAHGRPFGSVWKYSVKDDQVVGKVKIVGMDRNEATLNLIEEGAIDASIAQRTYTMAYMALGMLYDLHHNKVRMVDDWRGAGVLPLPTNVDTGTVVITKENARAFQRKK